MILVDVYQPWHRGFVVNTDDPDKAAEIVQKAIDDGRILLPGGMCPEPKVAGFHPTEDYEIEPYGEWENDGENPYEEIKDVK